MLKRTIFKQFITEFFMLKRYFYIGLVLSFANLTAVPATNSNNDKKNMTEMQKRQAIIDKDQMDYTDIFAIPLDDSEEEEDEEMEMLKAREQKFIQKQQNAPKTK